MITYGIPPPPPPLIRDLREEKTRVTQPWYADNAGAGGTFEHILSHFNDMLARGPYMGYFPDPTKSILVVSPRNVPRAEDLF